MRPAQFSSPCRLVTSPPFHLFTSAFRLVVSALFIAFAANLAHAQRDLKGIPVPDPEEERASFKVADGFEVNLFAADPLLAKPIQMNFDPQGRLWIASSEVYPQIAPGQKANDKIIVLEDTDGDGKADKTTVFADGLLIPTGVAPGDGGCYVGNSTELLFLKDSQGTGKADTRRVMLSGFGTEDTHHIVHTLRWGQDGMLYFNQSIYIHSHIETPHGVRRLNGGGIWQFRPETMQLEVLCKGFVNPWGHHTDYWGQNFATDGAYIEGINYVFPGSLWVSSPGAPRILKGLNPGSPKHCGLEIVSGRHLPDDWQGNMITNDFRAHRVCRFVVTENGSGYASREMPEVIKSNHVAFRPIDVKMGPDGAIYIADWYNPIIQHGEVDFRDPRRDHTHGRIWRVTAKNRPLVARPQLVGATVPALLEQLKAPEDWTRLQTKRVLKERGAPTVLPELANWLKALDPRDPKFEHHRLEALWVYQSLDTVEPTLLATLVESPDYHVRAAATRVLACWQTRMPNASGQLARLVTDENPRVRLEAVRALALLKTPRAAELALQALDKPVDGNLDFAIWQTARDLQAAWLPALQAGTLTFNNNARHLTFALQAVGTKDTAPTLVKLLQGSSLPPDRRDIVLSLLGNVGGPNELALLLSEAINANQPAATVKLLRSLLQAGRDRKVKPAGDPAAIAKLLSSPDDNIRQLTAELAGVWKLEALRSQLVEVARQDSTSAELRQSALVGLSAIGGGESVNVLQEFANDKQTPATRRAAVAALAGLNMKVAAPLAVTVLATTPADNGTVELVAQFLARKDGPAQLTAAFADKSLPPDVAKLAIRAVRSSPREEPQLLAAIQKAGKLSGGPKNWTAEEQQALVAAVKNADPARGEAIFRRAEQSCLKCHAIGGAGGQVGPDLVSIGASAQVDYLVESVLEPNKKIKEGFHAVTVQTEEGKVVTGIKVRQTDKDLLLRDAEDHEIAIPLDNIAGQKDAGSLMPAGLVDTLTQAEIADLVRFLSELGKVGPYAVSKSPLVRRWQTPVATKENLTFIQRQGLPAVIGNAHALTWTNIYSRVAGDLPVEDLATFSGPQAEKLCFLRVQLDVAAAGKLALRLDNRPGLRIWVDNQQLASGTQPEFELSPGLHQVTLALAPEARRAPLRVELLELPNSPGRAQWVGGK